MTNTITKERRDAIRAAAEKATPREWEDRHDDEVWTPADELIGAFWRSEDSSFVAICRPSAAIALLDALDAAEARAAQADHAAACLADMVKDLQAAAEAVGTAPEPVAWTSADNLDLMAYRGSDPPYEALMWSEPTPDHGVSLYRRPPAAEPVIPGIWATDAARDVLAERQRQVEGECWTADHDDRHTHGQLAYAAACYALQSRKTFGMAWLQDIIDRVWPFSRKWWRPSGPRRNLVKAGALILAEIERLDRLAAPALEPEADGA